MPASTAQRTATAERRTKAVAMRLAGADWQQIADRLGYASRGAAHTDVTRALEQAAVEQSRNAEVLRQQELLRLDRLQAGLWTRAVGGDEKAVAVCLSIIDRRCKLLGLDAPIKHEVVTLGVVEAEIARLEQQLASQGGSGSFPDGPPQAGAAAPSAGAATPGG